MNEKVVNNDPAAPRESFGKLFGQLVNNLAAIVHDEIELVIQGFREKTRRFQSGALMAAAGIVISIAAFLSLCAAVIIGLSSYMPPVFAAIITGTALALIGVVIASIGCWQLKRSLHKK